MGEMQLSNVGINNFILNEKTKELRVIHDDDFDSNHMGDGDTIIGQFTADEDTEQASMMIRRLRPDIKEVK